MKTARRSAALVSVIVLGLGLLPFGCRGGPNPSPERPATLPPDAILVGAGSSVRFAVPRAVIVFVVCDRDGRWLLSASVEPAEVLKYRAGVLHRLAPLAGSPGALSENEALTLPPEDDDHVRECERVRMYFLPEGASPSAAPEGGAAPFTSGARCEAVGKRAGGSTCGDLARGPGSRSPAGSTESSAGSLAAHGAIAPSGRPFVPSAHWHEP